ncbi:MAG: EAL domain-containing protein [Candidatus Thiodiazotropha taylori]|nr:EAL domain-containing protein [Candidatus Thiodiazotropha taylori]
MTTDERQNSWRKLVSATAAGILVVSTDGSIIFANPAATRLLGRKQAQDLVGVYFSHPRSTQKVQEIELIRPNGSPVVCEMYFMQGAWKDQAAWIVTLFDITERKQALAKLQLSADVFTHTLEGILITDNEGRIVDVNSAFSYITGYSKEEVIGKNPRFLKSGKHSDEFYSEMWHQLLTTEYWKGELWNRKKTGKIYPETLTISAVSDTEGNVTNYVGIFSDISRQKEHESELIRVAQYDTLTNLPNRSLLRDRLQSAMSQVRRYRRQLAVVYLDLDGFKEINDLYGHDAGDHLLVVLAERMQTGLRATDTICRMGGDEFVAVYTEIKDRDHCLNFLDRLLNNASSPVKYDNHLLQVSGSLGVAFYPQDKDVDADQLLRQADQAMYLAKLSGKNRYHFFDPAKETIDRRQFETLDAVKVALKQDEFRLHYQPKVNMRNGKLIGVEALIRWQHPQYGLLKPVDFLPLIENHNLMIEVGDWVIDSVLEQIEQWQCEQLQIPVSINISVLQLQQADFVESLKRRLRAHPKVSPDMMELEIVETTALKDFNHAYQVMQECSALGIGFSIDDFGTGYSSLTYMKRLPAYALKIDQSFVRNMLQDEEDIAILQGIIGLASVFKLQVIAEGVETPNHARKLIELGCEVGQGYAISRPLPVKDLKVWIESWTGSSWIDTE